MTSLTASQSRGFDIVSYTLDAKHGRATYVRSDVSDAVRVSSSPCCDVIRVGGYHIANVYKPLTEFFRIHRRRITLSI